MPKQETDAFEMTEEEFLDLKDSSVGTEEFTEEESTDIESTEDSSTEDSSQEESTEDFSADDFSTTDFSEDQEDQSEDQDPSGQEELIDIIHNGVTHSLTKDKIISLAQQGFDYQAKTTAIAPQRRLLQLVDSDPELQGVINKYVSDKVGPKVTSREDYETDEEWLTDNISETLTKVNPFIGENQDISVGSPSGQADIVQVLRNRDPEHFDTVAPFLKKAAGQIPKAKYDELNQDPNKIVQFYDSVKKHAFAFMERKNKPNQREAQSKNKTKTFNLKSGQSQNTGQKRKTKNVWDYSNKDFSKLARKVKGY